MTKDSETPKLEHTQTMEQERRISKDIVPSYIGKNIVLEVGDTGVGVCSGNLQKYDSRFLQIREFKQHNTDLGDAIEYGAKNIKYDLTNQESINYALPIKNIHANLVASIQTLEDVLNSRKVD